MSAVVDAWANLLSPTLAAAWTSQDHNASIGDLFGDDLATGGLEQLIDTMDDAGVAVAVVTGALRADADDPADSLEQLLTAADDHDERLLVSATVDRPGEPTANVARLRELAGHDRFVLVRVTPFLEQHPLDDRLYYPVYATCEALGLPVSINVGVPGPRRRSDCQDPRRLENVLIDFPDLTVVGAHMGHPYEPLLITYMLKWPRLRLMTSAYLADYMDPRLVEFMGSSRGRGRVWFASDHPILPMGRALRSARKLDLDEASMAAFLGGGARRTLLEE